MATVPSSKRQRGMPYTPTPLTGKRPVLESLIRSSGVACSECDGTGNAFPPGYLMEKCEECNGTGYDRAAKEAERE